MVWKVMRLTMCLMLASLAAMTEMPAPGKVTLEVEAYSKTMSGFPASHKVNQLRHVRYLKDKAHTLELMKKHAAILGPKFRAVLDALDREIAPLGIASWKRPTGGYFVSVDTADGLAKRTMSGFPASRQRERMSGKGT